MDYYLEAAQSKNNKDILEILSENKSCKDPLVLSGDKHCFMCTHESCPEWK
jgi:hypothetical protein